MKTSSHKRDSRLSLLMRTIHRVLKLPKMSRFNLAMDFVATVEHFGLVEVLCTLLSCCEWNPLKYKMPDKIYQAF